ncbi:rRNA maturation RNase YbeY [Candidatus Uhrbacteria bacterium]|nr:rRNA maturation RNase YbeY [Candidatus Uhrbacteria bacterium]
MTEISHFGRWPTVLPKTLADRAVRLALKVKNKKGVEGLGLVFVTEAKMKSLNKRYRGKSVPTDVLSFSPAEFPGMTKNKPGIGDIFICPIFVKRDSAKNGVPYPQQMLRVLVHGVLHLLGFDHATAKDEKTMFAKQEKIIKACGL